MLQVLILRLLEAESRNNLQNRLCLKFFQALSDYHKSLKTFYLQSFFTFIIKNYQNFFKKVVLIQKFFLYLHCGFN